MPSGAGRLRSGRECVVGQVFGAGLISRLGAGLLPECMNSKLYSLQGRARCEGIVGADMACDARSEECCWPLRAFMWRLFRESF